MGFKEGEIINIDGKDHMVIKGVLTPIVFKSIKKFFEEVSNREWFYLEKMRLKETHKEAASEEAMVEGCYFFLEIYECESEHPADNPKRFMAKVRYKSKPEKGYYDSKDDPFETIVRINPLLNKVSSGNLLDFVKKEGKRFPKNLDTFKNLFLKKEIHLSKIELVSGNHSEKKSYSYHWDLTGEEK